MLINTYNTTVGKQYKITDNVENTIKSLLINNSLKQGAKEGIFLIDHEVGFTEGSLLFPLTLKGFNGKLITVIDERPFRNKNSNKITNPNELEIYLVAGYLQQDAATGNLSPIKASRLVVTKGFAESVSSRLTRRAGMDLEEAYILKILLAYYAISLTEDSKEELDFIAYNLIKSIYGAERSRVDNVISEVPVLKTVNDLLQAIHSNPILFKLKSLTLKDLLATLSGITFSAFGGGVVGAAVESPIMLTALCYGVVKFRVYNKTPLGMALDPKYNRGNTIESFTNHLHFTYNLPR